MTNVKEKILLLNLTSLFLVFALVTAASAQTRTTGVSIGNTWRYGVSVDWNSNDPTATPSAYLVEENKTDWFEVEVTDISGTNVTTQVTTRYKNGTEVSIGGWIDIDTGNDDNMTFFIISSNLTKDDSIYTVEYDNWFINETIQRPCLSGVRETNHFSTISSTEVQYLSSNLYWDKATGIVVELFRQNISHTLNYTTSWSLDLRIISSDIWVVPEFPAWIPSILILMAFTTATLMISKQKRAHQKASDRALLIIPMNALKQTTLIYSDVDRMGRPALVMVQKYLKEKNPLKVCVTLLK